MIGKNCSGDGQFNLPEGIALDVFRNIYVADMVNHRIQVFDSQGNFLFKFGSMGLGESEFAMPFGIRVNDFEIYVTDTYDMSVNVLKIIQ